MCDIQNEFDNNNSHFFFNQKIETNEKNTQNFKGKSNVFFC